MLNLSKLLKRPKAFHSLTGLTPEKLAELVQQVEPYWKQSEINRKTRDTRKRNRGNRNDKKLYDQTQTIFPKKTKKLADPGYLGTDCIIPHKSSKLHKLTEEQNRDNKKHAKARIGVEHVFAHLKKFRILKDRYRNAIGRYNLIFKNICGLRNFILA